MSIDPRAIQDKAGLIAFLEGRTDAQINAAIAEVGPDEILGKVFAALEADYDAERGPGERTVLQWDVRTRDRTIIGWHVTVGPDGCRAEPGPAAEPDLTLTMGMVPFLKLMVGRLSGIKALATGKLKLKGNLLLAMSIEAWFVSS